VTGIYSTPGPSVRSECRAVPLTPTQIYELILMKFLLYAAHYMILRTAKFHFWVIITSRDI